MLLQMEKIRADAVAKDIRVKLAWYNGYVTATRFLFNDLQQIISGNNLEAFQSIVKSRIADYAKAQTEKEEAERKRIQAEEQRKAEAEQARKLEVERSEIRRQEQVKAREEAEQGRTDFECNQASEMMSIAQANAEIRERNKTVTILKSEYDLLLARSEKLRIIENKGKF